MRIKNIALYLDNVDPALARAEELFSDEQPHWADERWVRSERQDGGQVTVAATRSEPIPETRQAEPHRTPRSPDNVPADPMMRRPTLEQVTTRVLASDSSLLSSITAFVVLAFVRAMLSLAPMALGVANSIQAQIQPAQNEHLLDLDTEIPPSGSRKDAHGVLVSMATAIGRAVRKHSLPQKFAAVAQAMLRVGRQLDSRYHISDNAVNSALIVSRNCYAFAKEHQLHLYVAGAMSTGAESVRAALRAYHELE